MKRIVLLCIAVSLLASCSSTFMVAADDMYGTVPSREQVKKLDAAAAQTRVQPAENTESSYAYSESDADVAVEAGSIDTFNYDDYYDYEYTSRLRRFHDDNNYYVTNNYYSDYYTNSYWYDRDPYYFGTSIYLGYNWWTPYYYRPSWYYDWRWGWNYGWGYGCGYNPYYWGYGSYGSGYWDGYWAGRWDHYYWGCGGHHHHGHHGYYDWGYYDRPYDYCYNPYDRNTYNHADYGTRIGGGTSLTRPVVLGGITPSSGRADADNGNGLNNGNPTPLASDSRVITGSVRPSSFAQRYETAVASGESGRTGTKTVAAPDNKTTVSAERLTLGTTPSRQIESVSDRLSKKEVNVRTAVGTSAEVKTAGNKVADDGRTGRGVVNTASPSQPVRNVQGVRNTESVHSAESVRGTQVQPSHSNIPVQNQTVRSTTPVQNRPNAPTSASGSNSQPRQYSSPVYNSSRSSSSYTSPQYNRPATTTANTSRPATTSAPATTTSRPATTAAPSRPTTSAPSRPATTSAPSRPASSTPSRPASSGSSVSRSSGSYSSGGSHSSGSHSSGSSRSGGRR